MKTGACKKCCVCNLIFWGTTYCIFIFLTVEICLRSLGYKPISYGILNNTQVSKPSPFYIEDDLLGWKLSSGKFDFYIQSDYVYTCNIDSDGYRIIPDAGSGLKSSLHVKRIFTYGCSFTFGQSVSDTSNYPYYLQLMIPEYAVKNRGIPGYNLVQILLALTNDVSTGNKPDIAIINYASFLDERTILSQSWLKRFRQLLKPKKELIRLSYPYAKNAVNDSVIIGYLPWSEWPADWPLRNKSALINLANSTYENYTDNRTGLKTQKIIIACLSSLYDYCKENNIQLLFYGFNKESEEAFKYLRTKGAFTRVASINVLEDGYNCAPQDPLHPNARAHKIYAEDVYESLKKYQLIPERN